MASDPLDQFLLWLQNRNFQDLVDFIPPIVHQACLESRESLSFSGETCLFVNCYIDIPQLYVVDIILTFSLHRKE